MCVCECTCVWAGACVTGNHSVGVLVLPECVSPPSFVCVKL